MVCLSFGFYDYTIQLSNALSQKETVMLMLPNKVLRDELENIGKNVKLHLFNPKHIYYPSILSTIFQITKQIKTFNPDVIHFQFASTVLLCSLFPFLKKYPLVGTFHDVKAHVGEESLLLRFVMYYARRYSNLIIVHGEKLKEQMIKE
ncbi:glycosyltransferase, partial [Candidatus Parcubacteria bacterium]|nr:glycosyltransferase [Candidatus Parcubacteria bacterium]